MVTFETGKNIISQCQFILFRMSNTFNDRLRQVILLAIIILLALLLLKELYVFLPAFLGAITLYILLRKIYFRLTIQQRWNKILLAYLFIFASMILIAIPIYFSVQLIIHKVSNLLNNPADILAKASIVGKKIESLTGFNLITEENTRAFQLKAGGLVPGILNSSLNIISNFIIMFFVLYFLLINGREVEKAVDKFIPLKEENIVLLGNETRVLACSSPTGPAFEGSQISRGQRAAPGAIERVEIDPVTKEPRFRVIGSEIWSDDAGFDPNTLITGICGSGIIEAVAEMRMTGIVDQQGLIGSPEQTGTPRAVSEGRTHSYLLHDGTATGGPRIMVTQGDIRAIQLAKAALYAGARLLMDEMGVDHVDRVTLAGAFGAHISPKHAMVLGMIPDAPLDKVTSAGNAAGTGARIALCNVAARNAIEDTVHHIHKVETAIEPRFQEHFVNATAIPHATDLFPHLIGVATLPENNFNTAAASREGRRRR